LGRLEMRQGGKADRRHGVVMGMVVHTMRDMVVLRGYSMGAWVWRSTTPREEHKEEKRVSAMEGKSLRAISGVVGRCGSLRGVSSRLARREKSVQRLGGGADSTWRWKVMAFVQKRKRGMGISLD